MNNKRPEDEGSKFENILKCDLNKKDIPYDEQVSIDGRRIDILIRPNLFMPMFQKMIAVEATKQDSSGSAYQKWLYKLDEARKLSEKNSYIDEVWLVIGGDYSFPDEINKLKTAASLMPKVLVIIYPEEWNLHINRISFQEVLT